MKGSLTALAVACAGVALMPAGASPLVASGPSFTRPADYRTGSSPESVVAADLDGDGDADLAVASYTDEAVSVLLNTGNGRFQSRRDFSVVGEAVSAAQPLSVAIGDLDADGTADLVTANSVSLPEGSVSVLMNNGDGSFARAVAYVVGRSPGTLAVRDLDNDGDPDVAVADMDDDTVAILRNKGDGTLLAGRTYRVGRFPDWVAAGELDGDGRADVAVANRESGTISVLVGTGDGTFRPRRDYAVGGGAYSVEIADLNGDGNLDLASASSEDEAVSVLLNRGDGTFRPRRQFRTRTPSDSLVIGDLNADGRPDIAAANPSAGTISVLVNRGDAVFEPKLDYATRGEPNLLAIGDLSGDGRTDLVVTKELADRVAVFLNKPGLCTVQDVRGMPLATARRTTARAGCRVGVLRRVQSNGVPSGRVVSQEPRAGTLLAGGGRVDLIVSRGRRR